MPSALGRFIRFKRNELGLGLREFARMIGKSAPFVTQVELDESPPPAAAATLLTMAKVLKVDADELFALANKLPEDLTPETALEISLFRRVKQMSADDQKKLLKTRPKGQPDSK